MANLWFRISIPFVMAVAVLLPCAALAAGPTVGECLAASDSSIQLDSEHKLRAERAQLLLCAAESCPEDVRVECAKRVEQVNQALPSIVFEVKDSAGADVSAVKVTMDGELIADRLNGTAIAIDPGEHQFTFEIAGQPPMNRPLVIRVSEQNRRETLSFAPINQPLAQPTPPPAPVPTPPPPPEPHSAALSNQRIGALVAGGVGVVGVVIGSVFALQASSKKSTAQKVCPESQCPTQDGVDQWHKAKNAGTASTVAFIVGGVGLAGGAALWFTDKSASSERPQVGLGLGGIQLRGSW